MPELAGTSRADMDHMLSRLVGSIICLGLTGAPMRAWAQTTAAAGDFPPRPITSMGQPSRWPLHVAASELIDRTGQGAALGGVVGVHRSLFNPVIGLGGATAEVYGAANGTFSGAGARLLGSSPLLALGVGADWNVTRRRVDFLLSYQTAIRRGGLLGRGTMLRVDWLPTRARTFGIGIQAPLGQPFAGRTRPRHTDVDLPLAEPSPGLDTALLPPAAEAALTRVARGATVLRLCTSSYSGADVRQLRGSESYDAATRDYIDGLRSLFTAASGDSIRGARIADHARAGVLTRVLLPYDALFGRAKEQPDIRQLTSAAQRSFGRWLVDSSGVDTRGQTVITTLRAHGRWMELLEQMQADLLAQSKDSRTVWLPLRLALAPEQYDEQSEVDSLLARVIGRPFTDQNALTMLRSTDLPLEMVRSIYAARSYHVLWIHDFAGHALETGEVDNVSYSMVADAYLPALTAAVQRYDATGRLPAYMVFLDQFFYEPNDGRLWMTMLEHPLTADMSLPGNNADREAHLRARQQELRAAVAGSARLQAEARQSGGQTWLEQIVKVHVNIAYPADFSFRSHKIVPPLAIVPDNVMRDHRKIVLYDLDEADPYRGAMLLMGVGVGEHYASRSWEDRGYRLRGPAALDARRNLRQLLAQQGFSDDEIPPPLREVTSTRAVEGKANAAEYVGRALQVHNDVGFGKKESSVARAMLYDLAVPGSVMIVPDPLWLSAEWAGMLTGAAARGARVYVIAPALANAPSPEAPVMALAHEVLTRLLVLRDSLAEPIRRNGGELRIGLFAAHAQVDDPIGVRREVRDGLRRAPWIRDLIPFDDKTMAVLDRAETQAATDGKDATVLAARVPPKPPQLHQKTQLIARAGAIGALVRQPGWDEVVARAIQTQSSETAKFAEQLGYMTPDVDSAAINRTDQLLRGYEQSLPEAERRRVSFYFALGTQNQDPRGMMLDGETTLLVSGFHAASGLVDLYNFMARSTWITSGAELDQLLPPPSTVTRTIGQWLRPAF